MLVLSLLLATVAGILAVLGITRLRRGSSSFREIAFPVFESSE
jgi:hypothetical protein